MSQIKPEQLLDHLYNIKLPKVYREKDEPLKYPFYRYLSALIEGGFAELLTDTNNFLNLVDPEKIPEEILPIFCKSLGLDYLIDMPPLYQRRFLQNVGELVRRRGTYSGVKYLVRVLTGLIVDMHLAYSKQGNTKYLDITLIGETMSQIANMDMSLSVVKRYIQYQIPYNVNARLDSIVREQELKNPNLVYTANFVTEHKHYNLLPSQIKIPMNLSLQQNIGGTVVSYESHFVTNDIKEDLVISGGNFGGTVVSCESIFATNDITKDLSKSAGAFGGVVSFTETNTIIENSESEHRGLVSNGNMES